MNSVTNYFAEPVYVKGGQNHPLHNVPMPQKQGAELLFLDKKPSSSNYQEHEEFHNALYSQEPDRPTNLIKKIQPQFLQQKYSTDDRSSIEQISEPQDFLNLESSHKSNEHSLTFSLELSRSTPSREATVQGQTETVERKAKKSKRGLNNIKSNAVGDERKNLYGNSAKSAIRAYKSTKYEHLVDKIHARLQIDDSQEAKKYMLKELNGTICLGYLYDMLREEEGLEMKQNLYKKAFLIFYRWFMKEKYAIHVLQESKILNKKLYLEEKKTLVYLPELTEKAKRKLQLAKCIYSHDLERKLQEQDERSSSEKHSKEFSVEE